MRNVINDPIKSPEKNVYTAYDRLVQQRQKKTRLAVMRVKEKIQKKAGARSQSFDRSR